MSQSNSSARPIEPGSTVAFIGLGVMGFPMAGHLANAGYRLQVYNRTPQRAALWLEQYAGTACQTPAEAARNAQAVCVCVGNDNDVRAVTENTGGVFETLSAGSALIDHTTASEALAVSLGERAAQLDCGFVDAPVSGGQAGAENAALTVMCGAKSEHFEQVAPLLQVYGKRVRRLGGVGSGQLAKMVNQICIAGVLQGLAEGLHFAESAGLDVAAVVDVIAAGAAQSWQMDNRSNTMAQREFEFGFAVDWMRKDLGIALAAARERGASLPLTALVDQFYGDVQAAGGGRFDTSSLIQRLPTGT
ncbi:MAG: NAD(P)-dependent oxidoreductase [Pseudomonadales bacterium]